MSDKVSNILLFFFVIGVFGAWAYLANKGRRQRDRARVWRSEVADQERRQRDRSGRISPELCFLLAIWAIVIILKIT